MTLINIFIPINGTKFSPMFTKKKTTFFCRSWSHRLRPKKLHANVAVPAAPVRVLSPRLLAPSVASVTSVANEKGDNEMILGVMHRYPGICLTAQENPKKTSARRPSDEGAVTSHCLRWGPFPPNEDRTYIFSIPGPAVHGAMGCGQKNFQLV